jgi:hypothetical protein
MSGKTAFTASEWPTYPQPARHSGRMVNAPLPKYGGRSVPSKGYKRLTKPRELAHSAKLAPMLQKSAVVKI